MTEPFSFPEVMLACMAAYGIKLNKIGALSFSILMFRFDLTR
jgi:hypothetical protein